MPWKQVSVSPKEFSRSSRVIPYPRIYDLAEYRNHTNFLIPINGGVAKIRSGQKQSGPRFIIEAKLPESRVECLVESLGFSPFFSHGESENRWLHLKTTFSVEGEQIVYQLPITPYTVNGSYHFEMNPIMPKEFTQRGHRGAQMLILGKHADTLEGIDSELNDVALSLARQLHRVFGLEYGKLDAECVKSVCVYSRSVSIAELLELLKNRNIGIEFGETVRGYRGTTAALSVSYAGDLLTIKGSLGAQDFSGRYRITEDVMFLVRGLELTTDENKPMAYSKYYSTALQMYLADIANAIQKYLAGIPDAIDNATKAVAVAGAVVRKLSISPWASYRKRQDERREKLQTGLIRLLVDQIQPDKDASNGFCIIQYDPKCVLRKAAEPEGKPS